MSMKGIDISSWQNGIDLAKVPCDFVIIKATEGIGYISPSWKKQYKQARQEKKRLGVYHYANGGNVKAEADFFLKQAGDCIGEAILVLDWEGDNNPRFGVNDAVWVKEWMDYVYKRTKVKPFLYISQSVMERFRGIGNYPLWIAQYADMRCTGYQERPWNEGSYTCVIRQYSPSGRLPGYNGDLDLDKFYGDKAAWDKYAGKRSDKKASSESSSKISKSKEKSAAVIAQEVIDGKWGNGSARKKKLKAAGYNYSVIQKKVNELMKKKKEEKAKKYHTVKYGETLSGIAAKYGTTVAKLQKLNKISNPDRIHAGTRLIIK